MILVSHLASRQRCVLNEKIEKEAPNVETSYNNLIEVAEVLPEVVGWLEPT